MDTIISNILEEDDRNIINILLNSRNKKRIEAVVWKVHSPPGKIMIGLNLETHLKLLDSSHWKHIHQASEQKGSTVSSEYLHPKD